jgi:hypothetical protein
VVTGPGIISQPGGAVGLKPFAGFKSGDPAEKLTRPEVVFIFTGHLAGFTGNTKTLVKIKTEFSHRNTPYITVRDILFVARV